MKKNLVLFVILIITMSLLGANASASTSDKPFDGTQITIITTMSGPIKAIEKKFGHL